MIGAETGQTHPLGLQPSNASVIGSAGGSRLGQATLRQHYVIDIVDFIYAK
jgi:hypothetical protein